MFLLSSMFRTSTAALTVGLACFLATPACAQVSLTNSYTQNFNSLLNTGNSNAWTNNSTIAGWYATQTTYQASNGNGNTGDLYSFGSTGSVERALGSINSGSTGTIQFGLQLRNLSGVTITSLNIAYTGEQWRNGGNTATPDSFVFEYFITSSSGNQLTTPGYTAVPSLDFINLIAQNPAGPLDGNLPANSTNLSTVLSLSLAPNDYLWLRWTDTPKTGNDHGLGIDNFSVAVPEPATVGLMAVSLLCLGGYAWKKRVQSRNQLATVLDS